ncbi:hypothetical protein GYH30_055273 [Glycine max]|uniref:Uncharacterized protein n=2 Tax=Glycine subgen. Soja TaxID=1462606 RepID=K7N2E3_SOYBN|nr:hypothetical protein GYH30_055273 [Glycine max]
MIIRAEPSRINHFSLRFQTCAPPHAPLFIPLNLNSHPPYFTFQFSLSHTLKHFSYFLSLRRRYHAPPHMAESHSRTRPSRRKPSRLQSRAPSSLQINRALEWNVAIPLLSPLASSPPPLPLPPQKEDPPQQQRPTEKVVFKKWQHPAAPFCYEPPSLVPPFVNV